MIRRLLPALAAMALIMVAWGKQGIQDIRLQVVGRGNGQITNGLANLVAVNLAHDSENT